MIRNVLQLNAEKQLKHFLSMEGLKRHHLIEILDTADFFMDYERNRVKKVPLLKDQTIVNLFFEPSTRTRMTFEQAAKSLGANVMNLNISTSSAKKGETLLDTLHNIEAMGADMFVVRHQESGAAHFIAQHTAPGIPVLNAGDGRHSHPTQGMLDMMTIRHFKKEFGPLKVAIVGDIMHSRVARSQIHALTTLEVTEVRVVGPQTLLPRGVEKLGVHVHHDLKSGLDDVDVVIMLRLQNERMDGALIPSEREYFKLYGLTEETLKYAKDDAIVMHPGPINRGVEMDSPVVDGDRSVILQQVTFGIAVRMAVMCLVMGVRPLEMNHG